ncbi:hypothetical protein [Paracoccus nototheniae]|uniref:hypothetical protein n=1 Tax=Paracoccus nototheniae TaxID=2489002 RepID=UPI00103A62EA|nr:hypothetical protein [Paracoccus nototheniae]
MSLNDFIESQRGGDDSFWFFQHIPKTAGSSFSTELRKRQWPYANITVDYTDMVTPHDEKLARSVSAFLDEAKLTTFRSASGHLKLDQVNRVAEAMPDCRVVTFLRSPEARVISDFRYQRTPMHPPYQQFIERFPTLESYVESPDSQNKMADFLLGSTAGMSAEDAVASVGRSHVFIGLLEMYPMSFNIMFRLMGHDGLWPVEHQRKTPDDETTKVVMTPQLRAMIRRTNRLDQAIYDHAHAVLVRHREAFKQLDQATARA